MAMYHCELRNSRRSLGTETRSIADIGDDVELRTVLVAMCKRKGVKAPGHKLVVKETPGGYTKAEVSG